MSAFRAATVLAAALALAASASGGGSVSGDRGAIAFSRKVQAAYANVPAVRTVVRGQLSYSVSGGSFHFYYGQPLRPGTRPATESILTLLKRGRIVKIVIVAKAKGLPPLSLIEAASGLWAALDDHPGPCYYRQPDDALGGSLVGQPFVEPYGRYAPLERRKGTIAVTSTYPWGDRGPATQVDTVDAATRLLVSTTVRIAGPTPFSFTIGYQRAARPQRLASPSPQC